MKRLLKSLLWVVATVVVIAMAAPYALRGKIVEIVKREANDMLQARLDFDRVNISLLRHFPNASLDLRGLTLVGVDRFEGDTIVAADRISVVVNVASLFGDEGFEVKKVLLDAPLVHGRKLADGAVNWDVMKPADAASEEVVEEVQQAEEATEGSSFRLAVRDFRITEAVIRYEDEQAKLAFSTEPLDLRLRGDLSAAQSELDLRLKMERVNLRTGVVPMLSNAEVELKATIAADLEQMRFSFSENELRLNAIALTLDGWAQLLDDEAIAMDLKAGTSTVQFKDVLSLIPAFYMRDFRSLTAGGELALSLWAKGEMRGEQLPQFELKTEVKDGRFQYASLPKAVTGIQLAARVANQGGNIDKTVVEVSKLAMNLADNALSASFYGTNLMSDPQLKATLHGDLNLADIGQVYPLEEIQLKGQITADLKAAGRLSDLEKQRYERFSAAGTFVVGGMELEMPSLPTVNLKRAAASITPAAMTLGELNMTVGQSDVVANGQLSNYLGYLMQGTTLSGRLYMKSNLLELNELMTAMASDEPAEESKSEKQSAPAGDGAMAVEVPENLSLSLSTDLRKILFQKMTIENVKGEVRVADGAVRLNNLGMKLFEGTATASGSYSAKADPKRPVVAMQFNFEDASFQQTFGQLEMVQQLAPIFEKTGGRYAMKLDMNATLDEQLSPDLQRLTASGQLKTADIKIQNIELFGKLADLLKNDRLRNIEAEDVTIDFTVKDGRITTQPFDLKVGTTVMTFVGSTGLDQTIDYEATIALPEGTAGGVLSKMKADIGGTFTKPTIELGMREVVKESVTNVVMDQVSKYTESKTVDEEINKQVDALRQEAREAGDQLVKEAEQQSQKLIKEAAKKGKLAEIAAQATGNALIKEARKQADKLVAAAEEKIEKLRREQAAPPAEN